jgi:hypothetical protein
MTASPTCLALAIAAALLVPAGASAQTSVTDPVGTISNVSSNWAYYQPASDFCVPDQVFEFPSDSENTQTGANPACAFSGFSSTDTGLYEVKISTPPLCSTCARLFIDYSQAQPNALGESAQGHAYYRLSSANLTYASSPVAHSPNIKNFTNDWLIAPPGSAQATAAATVDPHLLSYAAETARFAHTTSQGPYYIGPWYVNTAGQRINGAFIDVDLSQAVQLGSAAADSIYYAAGYNAEPRACPDSAIGGAIGTSQYNDGNYFYGGCVNFGGFSSQGVDPWPGG